MSYNMEVTCGYMHAANKHSNDCPEGHAREFRRLQSKVEGLETGNGR